jgi:hypothetical protein
MIEAGPAAMVDAACFKALALIDLSVVWNSLVVVYCGKPIAKCRMIETL